MARQIVTVFCAISFLIFGRLLPGAEIEWLGLADGNFHNHENWQGGVVPGSADTAIIVDGNHSIYSTDAAQIAALQIGNLDGAASSVNASINISQFDAGQLVVVESLGATLELQGGSLTIGEIVMGNNPGQTSTATVEFISGNILLGTAGIRTLPDFTAEFIVDAEVVATAAGDNLFRGVQGPTTVDVGGSLEVAGNIMDAADLSDRVSFTSFSSRTDLTYFFQPDVDTTLLRPATDLPKFLFAGDADQNGRFDQLDIVRVLQSGKYLIGQAATWGDGDWNGAPGGRAGRPPTGDGVFDQDDIVASLIGGTYLMPCHFGGCEFFNALDDFQAMDGVIAVAVPEPTGFLVALQGFVVMCCSVQLWNVLRRDENARTNQASHRNIRV